MKIEFDSDFNKFEYQEKLIYIQKLLNDNPLNVVVANLIYNTDDVFLCFKLMNEISKTSHFKSKNKIKTISLASLLINTLVVQNKNQDLYNYLNCIDKNTLKQIILYETNNKTIQEELAEDLCAIIHSFSGKLYGMRNKQFKELKEDLNNIKVDNTNDTGSET